MASGSGGTSSLWTKEASSFSISDFCAGVSSRLPSSWLASLDFLQDVAQLAGGAFCGGGGIIEFMRESRRKLSQRSQSVALLLSPSGFANPVGHQAHEALRQLRHLLHKFGKQRSGKAQDAGIRDRARAHGKLLHSRKGQHSGYVARLQRKHDRFAAEFAAHLKLPLENHEHRVGRIALRESMFRPP